MMKQNENGSVAVECALSIPLVVLLLLVLIQFFFLCIERQLMNYSAVMAARSRMVRSDGAYQALARQIVPWATAEAIPGATPDSPTIEVRGHKTIFNLQASPLGEHYQLKATVPVFPHAQTRTLSEDNAIRCPGGQLC